MIATWQIIGFYSYFEWEHFNVRKNIKCALKQSVPESQLKSFYFTTQEIKNLTWIKSNEFKLNGRFYDVIERIPTERGFHFKCIDDFQETKLFQRLEESTVINLNNSTSSSPLKHWLKLLKTPFVADFECTKMSEIESFTGLISVIFCYKEIYSLQHSSIVFTPPKHLFI